MSKINNSYILIVVILIFIAGGVILNCFLNKKESAIIPQEKNTEKEVREEDNQDKNKKITYKTFSSPKADFTFEYPDTWAYDEKGYEREINNTTIWGFYSNLESNYRNRPPYLEVSSPSYEVVDFCSGGYDTAKGYPYDFTISVFPTNDPETFVTYEQCGIDRESGSGYIYWQKGKYFANATDIGINNIYKINIMTFHGSDELEGRKVAQHIAQSIKIK